MSSVKLPSRRKHARKTSDEFLHWDDMSLDGVLVDFTDYEDERPADLSSSDDEQLTMPVSQARAKGKQIQSIIL